MEIKILIFISPRNAVAQLCSQKMGLKWRPEAEVLLTPTVSRPVCFGVGHTSTVHDQIFITVRVLKDGGRSVGIVRLRTKGHGLCKI
jgi:hypothetical protein